MSMNEYPTTNTNLTTGEGQSVPAMRALYQQLYTLDVAVLGQRIKQTRIERGITQAELGRAAYCDEAELEAIEAGRTRPIMPVLREIAARLQQPVSYFLGEQEQEQELSIDLQEV